MSWQDQAMAHLQQTGGSLSLDSRSLAPGDVFVALPGGLTDGRNFLANAVALANTLVLAEALSAEHYQAWRTHPAIIWVRDLRGQLGSFLKRWFGVTAQRALSLIGVTGTNGKTSVSQFLAQALSAQAPCAVLGTVGQGVWPHLQPTQNTTLDIVSNHRLLAAWADQGAQHAVMEVSSHALDQGRVDGLDFAVALFTNLSHDHLDYHGTMANYFAAKRQLFAPSRAQQAVACIDDAWGQQLVQWRPDTLTVSAHCGAQADIAPRELKLMPTGIAAQWQTPWGPIASETAVVGDFNVANLALVIAALGLMGWSVRDIAQQVSQLQPVAGRMQCVELSGERLAIIDYAHTPEALAKALAAARQHTEGQLHCVFGCGGDRDRSKRAPMGREAETRADVIWLTSDNNRSESFAAISADILSGMNAHASVQVIADRAEAISAAIAAMRPGDAVLIAGKGHETYQEEQGQRRAFSDLAAVQACKESGS